MIDCREAVRRMWAYLDRSLETEPLERFEEHLETCTRCCGELEFSRHLRAMVAAGDAALALPADVLLRVDRLIATGREEGEEAQA